MTIERNPDACCGNCPYWFPINKEQSGGACRSDRPQILLLPVTPKPGQILQGAPTNAQTLQVTPQEPMTVAAYVCGAHPEFFPEDEDDEPRH